VYDEELEKAALFYMIFKDADFGKRWVPEEEIKLSLARKEEHMSYYWLKQSR